MLRARLHFLLPPFASRSPPLCVCAFSCAPLSLFCGIPACAFLVHKRAFLFAHTLQPLCWGGSACLGFRECLARRNALTTGSGGRPPLPHTPLYARDLRGSAFAGVAGGGVRPSRREAESLPCHGRLPTATAPGGPDRTLRGRERPSSQPASCCKRAHLARGQVCCSVLLVLEAPG